MSPVPGQHSQPFEARPRKYYRLVRLSLRTALLLVTLACVALAILAQRVREQRLAVARIQELGGFVEYDFQFDADRKRLPSAEPPGWPWLRTLLGDDYFQSVIRVHLDSSEATDADMQLIGKLRSVRELSLNGTRVSDAGVSEIRSRRIEYLGLMDSQVTSRGLLHLTGMPIDTLILQDTAIDDTSLEALSRLPKLHALNLGGTKVTGAMLPEMPQLRLLFLSYSPVDDRAIPRLLAHKSLTELHVNGTKMSGPGLLELREALPSCQVECDSMEINWAFDESEPARLQWQQVIARASTLDPEGRLKLLDLSGSQITDRHLADLHGLSRLELLDLRDTRVTPGGIAALREVLPECDVRR